MSHPKKESGRARRFVTRFLRLGDIPALLDLERKQWTDEQAASADDFRERIATHPAWCGGAFCRETGELLASLFCKPTRETDWTMPADWAQCADLAPRAQPERPRDLFGISLTSIDPGAAAQLIAFQWLYALKHGYRQTYLGSPIPGLRRALQREPGLRVEDYVHAQRGGLPRDPQLRYYHGKGFCEIVAIRAGYFPHEASCDYGVILRGRIPFQRFAWLFRFMPITMLRGMASVAPRWFMPRDEADERDAVVA